MCSRRSVSLTSSEVPRSDLMVWPDLDVTVVCDALDVAALHLGAADLVRHPRVRQLTFRNDSGPWNTQPEKYPCIGV